MDRLSESSGRGLLLVLFVIMESYDLSSARRTQHALPESVYGSSTPSLMLCKREINELAVDLLKLVRASEWSTQLTVHLAAILTKMRCIGYVLIHGTCYARLTEGRALLAINTMWCASI